MIYVLFSSKLDLVQNQNQANLALRLWISLVASTLQGARCLAGRVHGRCRQRSKEPPRQWSFRGLIMTLR